MEGGELDQVNRRVQMIRIQRQREEIILHRGLILAGVFVNHPARIIIHRRFPAHRQSLH